MNLLLACSCVLNGVLPDDEAAERAATLLLWPDGAPGVADPAPKLYRIDPKPELKNGTAVVVCPGGGYMNLATGHEGADVAQWLTEAGITVFVLDYRRAPHHHYPAPFEDAQRAVRTVRTHARDWQLDANRIGIMGFSAGGHLASTVGTHFDAGTPSSPDIVERASSRPDFMILVYPVITLVPPFVHMGSRRNLLGERQDDSTLLEQLSNEKQVTPETPPTFLVHSSADMTVPAENSVMFYLALRNAKVPAEIHIFENGPHGFGLAPDDPILSRWPAMCMDWMKQRGLLNDSDPE